MVLSEILFGRSLGRSRCCGWVGPFRQSRTSLKCLFNGKWSTESSGAPMVRMPFGCCRGEETWVCRFLILPVTFHKSACQHSLSQSYLSSCLSLRALGSKGAALVLICHINQQCCKKWVSFPAQLGWGSGLFSARQGDSRRAGQGQAWLLPRLHSQWELWSDCRDTLTLHRARDGRGDTTSASWHPTDAPPSLLWQWPRAWPWPIPVKPSTPNLPTSTQCRGWRQSQETTGKCLGNAPLLAQPLSCCSFQSALSGCLSGCVWCPGLWGDRDVPADLAQSGCSSPFPQPLHY